MHVRLAADEIDAQDVAAYVPQPIATRLAGAADWKARIVSGRLGSELNVASDLKGVASTLPEPFAKTSAPGIILTLPNGPTHSEQYFLGNLSCIGVLQAAAARTQVDERTVDIDEGFPGFAIACVVNPPQQGRTCGRARRFIRHRDIPWQVLNLSALWLKHGIPQPESDSICLFC